MNNDNKWIEEEIESVIKQLRDTKELVKGNKIRDARRQTNSALSNLSILAKTINEKADLNK